LDVSEIAYSLPSCSAVEIMLNLMTAHEFPYCDDAGHHFDYKDLSSLTLKVTGDILLHYLNKCIKYITGDNFLFCKTAHFSANHVSNTVKVVGRKHFFSSWPSP